MNLLKHHWYLILATAFLLGSFGDWPYSYYQILRWVVVITAAYAAYQSYVAERWFWTWTLGLIAILFNPVIPFYFGRGTWELLDLGAAAVFIVFMFRHNPNTKHLH